MDAASNRSVDDVRELRERVGYAPAAGRWKVYILDEAHMLTKEAWNAFLKTLEEPPPNTVFVLATTEPQKVMATIVDRCQRFDFQRPSLEQIAEVVRRVADAEGIEVDDGAVALIARSAAGSFRDALGTLDQLVAFGGDKVATDDVVELLGAADAELLFEATDALGSGDAAGGAGRGRPPRALGARPRPVRARPDRPPAPAAGRPRHRRGARVVHGHGRPARHGSPSRRAGSASAKLMGAIDALSVAIANMREGDDPRLSLEVALLKVTRPSLDTSQEALLRRIEALEARAAAGAGLRPGQRTVAPRARPRRRQPEPADPEPAEEPKGPVANATETATAVAALDRDRARDRALARGGRPRPQLGVGDARPACSTARGRSRWTPSGRC